MDLINYTYQHLILIFNNPEELFISVFVVVLLVETPYTFFILLAVIGNYFDQLLNPNQRQLYYPKVSCIITAYNEGKDILTTLTSLEEQFYKGPIEILVLVDGADVNKETLEIAMGYKKKFNETLEILLEHQKRFHQTRQRTLKVMPKWQRGGHASSSNLGVKFSTGDLVMTLDADTSCDNDMVSNMVQKFADPRVISCSGTLRVRNVSKNLLTRMQGVEYMLGIHLSKIALAKVNSNNNVSSAYGCYRKSFLEKTTLWRNGSAEDLDFTLRQQFFFKRHKGLKVVHAQDSIAHTEAPEKVWGLIKQRMRWDGDTYFIYIRRHLKRLLPKYLGWKTFFFTVFSGLFLHAVQPIVIVLSLIYTAFIFPLRIILPIYAAVYIYYVVLNFALYITFILLVSERRKQDLKLWYVIFLMPFYSVFLKFVSSVAVLSEFFIKTHRDSTMAPAWVNKKVK